MFDERKRIEAALAGDEKEFESLVQAVTDAARSHVSSRIPAKLNAQLEPADIAQCVAQNFAIANSKGKIRYESAGKLRALVNAITQNCLLDAVRKFHTKRRGGNTNQVDLARGSRDLLMDIAGEQETPSSEILAAERAGVVQEAIAQLSEEERMILESRYFDQCTNAEIAKLLDKSVSSVNSTVYRSKGRLVKVLQTRGYLTTYHFDGAK